jgi:Tol biopolymer transport system component
VVRRFGLLAGVGGLVLLASGCGSSGSGLFVVNPTGTSPKKVLSGCIDSFAWSPDGNSIALIRSGGLQILNLRDGRNHLVARNADEFSWSPDGSKIAWGDVPFYGDGRGLSLASSTGNPQPRMIWRGQLRSLAWAPDGKHIAFLPVRTPAGSARVALLHPDGRGLTYLTGPIAEGFLETAVRWFPDSKRLLFLGSSGLSVTTPLLVVDTRGGRRRLAAEPSYSWPPGGTYTISPDGAHVAYSLSLNRSGPYGTDPNVGEIFIVNAGGSGRRYLGHGALGGWSPDGKQLAFVHGGLYIMNANGMGRRKIAANGGDAQWSSQGQIAYTYTPLSCFS